MSERFTPIEFAQPEALEIPEALSTNLEQWPIPVAEDQEHLRVDTRLGYAVYDLTGDVQQFRGKENKIYTDIGSGEQFFAKYVTQQEVSNFDDVAGMAQEKLLLDYLAPTGVVPKTGALRIYPNAQKARLLLEKLPGASLDSDELSAEAHASGRTAEVVVSTAQSLQKVHDAGVLVGDLNQGTFIVDISSRVPQTKIVDLEIGCHVDDSPERLQDLAKWCARFDVGLRKVLNENSVSVDEEMLKKIEIHRWGKVVSDWVVGDFTEWLQVSLDASQQAEIEQVDGYVGDVIRQDLEVRLRRMYKNYYEPMKARGNPVEDEEDFVSAELALEYPDKLREAAKSVYFKALVDQQMIDLPESISNFIIAALQVDPAKRPTDFSAILFGTSPAQA